MKHTIYFMLGLFLYGIFFVSCHQKQTLSVCEKDETGGGAFVAKTVEGIDMIFTVLSEKNKTVEVCDETLNYFHDRDKYGAVSNDISGYVTIPEEINGYKVVKIGDYAFGWCRNLEGVSIPQSVMSIGNFAFHLCQKVETISIPNGVISIGNNAFSDCKKITTLYLPKTVETIGENAFSGCSNLVGISIPNSVRKIGNAAFHGCGLKSITIPGSINIISKYAFWGCDSLSKVEMTNSITEISNSAFSSCNKLSELSIPNRVQTIKKFAFEFCESLKSIYIPQSVTFIEDEAFDCRYVDVIVVDVNNNVYDSRNNSNAIVETVSNKLVATSKNTIIPNTIKEIGLNAFSHSIITKIVIPEGVEIIGNSAFYASKLCSIVLPESLKEIGSGAFSRCRSLKSIVIQKNVEEIGNDVFQETDSLSSIIVAPENNKYDSRDNCNAIIETKTNTIIAGNINSIIPNSVVKISKGAFRGNKKLVAIEIPSGITEIEPYSFAGCYLLESVKVHINNPFPIKDVFPTEYEYYKKAVLYVPKGTKHLYELCDGWKEFNSIVEMR